MDRTEAEFSKHATKRMQQRGIKTQVVETILTYADREVHIGDNSIALSVSKHWLATLQKDGNLSAQLADRVNGKCLIVANDNGPDETSGTVVTALHIYGKTGRSYRKSRRGYYRGQK